MTYLFSLEAYRIFFPPFFPAPSILKFCYEVPYIHNWVKHSTWKLISLSSEKCYWMILLIIAFLLFFPMTPIFCSLSALLLFRCQIFRLTFKPTFLSSFCSIFWDFLDFPFQLLYWIFHLLFLVSSSFMFFQCFFYDILLLYIECNIFYFLYLRLLILFFPLFFIYLFSILL